ncbi:MAG: DUF6064 family protein [Stagnimonas sp.]|nr:DUF6064 family protein [Stagnimonas sp.]
MLPFTHAEFIEVFARYNENVWPAQGVAYLLAIAMLAAIAVRWRHSGRLAAGGLALMWLWTGIAYHGIHFSAINRAAYLFGALFVVQALLLIRAALANRLRFATVGKTRPWLGWGLVAYATILYPMLGLWVGLRPVEVPMFGITPCPVTIFTFGIFLLSATPVPRWLVVVPVLWALVGGSAAFLLHVPQDWVLVLSGLSVILLLRPGDSMAAARFKE